MTREPAGYEIVLAEKPGRLMQRALRDVSIRDHEARVTLSGTCPDLAAAVALLTRMRALGLTVTQVRISKVPDGSS